MTLYEQKRFAALDMALRLTNPSGSVEQLIQNASTLLAFISPTKPSAKKAPARKAKR